MLIHKNLPLGAGAGAANTGGGGLRGAADTEEGCAGIGGGVTEEAKAGLAGRGGAPATDIGRAIETGLFSWCGGEYDAGLGGI